MKKVDSEGLFESYPLFEKVDLPEPEPIDYNKIGAVVQDPKRTIYIVPDALIPEYEVLIKEEELKEKPKSKFVRRIADTLLGWIYKEDSHNERTPRDNYKK